jgi:hypothetical protein
LTVTPPAVWAVYRIKGEESLLFPVPANQFPVPTKNIPCSNVRGIRVQDIENNTRLDIKNHQTGRKNHKFPVIFPVLREFEGKEWGD